MEERNMINSPALGHGIKTESGFYDHILKNPEESVSTPNVSVWPSLPRRLEDSGYCSVTPRSPDFLGGSFERKCNLCNKLSSQNYAHSTPEYITCSCKKNKFYENPSPHLEYLHTSSETTIPSSKSSFSKVKKSRPIDLYDEAMDTSLYNDEMELDHVSGDGHQCALGLPEIGEENSIDFLDGSACLSSCEPKSLEVNEIKKSNCSKIEVLKSEQQNFAIPEPEIYKCEIASPQCSNETTPTKTKRCRQFQSAAKKVTTLNWILKSVFLIGLDKVDFFYQLSEKLNCTHIVSKILSFVPSRDLDSVRVVSKTWNKILLADPLASKRWKDYRDNLGNFRKSRSELKYGMEAEEGSLHMEFYRSGPRVQLGPIDNYNRTASQSSNGSPPTSPDNVRFNSYQKAAKTLKQGDRLLPCPKCFFPSCDRGNPTVRCSRSGCQHSFCVWCRNSASPTKRHSCPPLYSPRLHRTPRTHNVAGSKSSKWHLRRLL